MMMFISYAARIVDDKFYYYFKCYRVVSDFRQKFQMNNKDLFKWLQTF